MDLPCIGGPVRGVWALLPLLLAPRAADTAEGELSGFGVFASGAEKSVIVKHLASRSIEFDDQDSSIHFDDVIENDEAITTLTFKDDRLVPASTRFEADHGTRCGPMRDSLTRVVHSGLVMKYGPPDMREVDDDALWRIKSDRWVRRFRSKAVIKAYYSILSP